MDFTDLSPTEAFWQSRGLKYLLTSEDLPEILAFTAYAAMPRASVRKQKAYGAYTKREQSHSFKTKDIEGKNIAYNVVECKIKSGEKNNGRISQDALPKVWADLLQKSRPGRIAWTYYQLGADLLDSTQGVLPAAKDMGENTLEQRRGLLKRFIQELGYPSGTHTFWPHHLSEDFYGDDSDSIAREHDYFWRGISHLGCRYLIVLGSDSAAALFPKQKMEAKMKLFMNGLLIYFIGDIPSLLNNTIFFQSEVNFLKTELNFLP